MGRIQDDGLHESGPESFPRGVGSTNQDGGRPGRHVIQEVPQGQDFGIGIGRVRSKEASNPRGKRPGRERGGTPLPARLVKKLSAPRRLDVPDRLRHEGGQGRQRRRIEGDRGLVLGSAKFQADGARTVLSDHGHA